MANSSACWVQKDLSNYLQLCTLFKMFDVCLVFFKCRFYVPENNVY